MTANNSSTAPRLERIADVIARTGLSRSGVYALLAARDFPPPVKLGGRAIAWSAIEIDAWISARLNARDAKAAA